MSYTDYHISMISGIFEPKIIGDTNEQLLTPEDLLSGNAEQKLIDTYPKNSLTNSFDEWLFYNVINAYTHNICSTNDNLTAEEKLMEKCLICTTRDTFTEQPDPASELYILNSKKIPEHFMDSKQHNNHWFGSSRRNTWSGYWSLKKEIVDYIQKNNWTYGTNPGIKDHSSTIISPICSSQFNEQFIRKLFIQWFNRYVINNHFYKYNQTIEIPRKETPILFMHLAFMHTFLTDTVEKFLCENGWSCEWSNSNSVTIKPSRTVEKDIDSVKLYSPKNMPDFVRQTEQDKAKLLKDFTLWFNQEVKDAYLARYNHKQCLHDTIIVTNDHININLEQVPDKFTELTHDGTALKPSIMQYLLDNDWQYEVTAKKCLQLNL